MVSSTYEGNRVLWIDDEVDVDDAAIHLLRYAGYSMDCARSGIEGIAKARAERYRAIILDLRLPDIPGLTVLGLLKGERIDAGVMILTGYVDSDCAQASSAMGIAGWFSKPLLGDELVSAVSLTCGYSLGEGRPLFLRESDEVVDDADSSALSGFLRRLITILSTDNVDPIHLLAASRACRALLNTPSGSFNGALALLEGGIRLREQTSPTVTRALSFLAEAIRNRTAVTEVQVADWVHVHPAHLGRLMKHQTGIGFHDWRALLRAGRSIPLLLNTNEQVSQITYKKVGLQHPSQYAREFRRFFGTNPKQFRAAVRPKM